MERDKNIRWKVEIPGRGKSTPVVWGDLLFLTAAVPSAKPAAPGAISVGSSHPAVRPAEAPLAFVVLAYARATGPCGGSGPSAKNCRTKARTRTAPMRRARCSPTASRVYAFFGSRGLHAFDMDGKPVWQKDLGRMQTRNAFGEGASPALHGDTLVVNWDHEGADFIVGARQPDRPGEVAPRPRRAHHVGDAARRRARRPAQVVVNGRNRVVSYDVATGEPLWQAPGLTDNVFRRRSRATGWSSR